MPASVLTDSGGVQKESYFFKKVSLIFLLITAPGKKLVDASYNVLVDDCPDEILRAFVDKWVRSSDR